MRRVVFKAYIDGKTVEGLTGSFHRWGLATDEPNGSYTVAIIEQDGGQVITTFPDWVRFDDGEVRLAVIKQNGQGAEYLCVSLKNILRW